MNRVIQIRNEERQRNHIVGERRNPPSNHLECNNGYEESKGAEETTAANNRVRQEAIRALNFTPE